MKLEAIQKIKSNGYGASIKSLWGDLAPQKKKNRKNQLKKWVKKEKKLILKSLETKNGLAKKTIHAGKAKLLSYWEEKAIYNKFNETLRNKIVITGSIIKQWASFILANDAISKRKKTAGDKWLRNWCERWSVSLQVKYCYFFKAVTECMLVC